MLTRLQKVISEAGIASRRHAERLMSEGRVTVNGRVVRTLGAKADPARDDVRVDGRRVSSGQRRRYFLLNKPRGYVTTRSDPQGRPTVLHLLAGVREYVYPVGRLDFDSEGLLLLTNDGDLAARMTHPRHGLERIYEAQIVGRPDRRALQRLSRGVAIDGRQTREASVRVVRTLDSPGGDLTVLRIAVREGRNRQVRRMCEAVGHPVVRLRRIRIGPINDASLRPGSFRELTASEVAALRRATAAEPTGPGPKPQPRG